MKNQSIEFGKMNEDLDQSDNVRKSFRVPVEDVKKIWVIINAQRYNIIDICFDGIRISIDNASEFQIDESLSNCELHIFDVSVIDLQGRVVHISPDENKQLQCGIQWMDASEGEAEKILQMVSEMKKQLLNDDTISYDSP